MSKVVPIFSPQRLRCGAWVFGWVGVWLRAGVLVWVRVGVCGCLWVWVWVCGCVGG